MGRNEIGFLRFAVEGVDGWMETEGYNIFWELGALTYAAIYLERPILGEIWEGGDSWAGLGYC